MRLRRAMFMLLIIENLAASPHSEEAQSATDSQVSAGGGEA
jgi:hypothetical protein